MQTTVPDTKDYFTENVATFGDRLEAARLAKGMTSQQLAERIGVKNRTVDAWENNSREPRANKVQMLAGLLNVSMMWLMSGQGNGTFDVVENYDRPEGVNDTLTEMRELKRSLLKAVDRIEELEGRLLETT